MHEHSKARMLYFNNTTDLLFRKYAYWAFLEIICMLRFKNFWGLFPLTNYGLFLKPVRGACKLQSHSGWVSSHHCPMLNGYKWDESKQDSGIVQANISTFMRASR